MNFLEQQTKQLSSNGLSDPGILSVRNERPDAEICEKFVAFLLGSDIFCVPSDAVLEVVHPLPVSPLPNAPSSISGISAFRGDVVAVVNITEMLGRGESNAGSKAKLVILRADPKHTQFAIPVDSMYELIGIPPEAMAAHPNTAGALSTRVEQEGSVFHVIDTDALFESLERSIG